MSDTQASSGAQLKITLVKSTIGRPFDQGRAVKSLGLRKLNDTVVRPDDPSIGKRGTSVDAAHLQ